jgi:hypothetical protein
MKETRARAVLVGSKSHQKSQTARWNWGALSPQFNLKAVGNRRFFLLLPQVIL